MPELPEVEIAARNLRRWCVGATIVKAHVGDERILGKDSAALDELEGEVFGEVTRRGKHMFAEVGERALWLHLGMSGKLFWRTGGELPTHTRVRLDFSEGSLCLQDPRLLGGVALLDRGQRDARLAKLGRDALEVTSGEALAALFPAKSSKAIKLALMDQARLAGMGNIQAAEALFRARVHPQTPVKRLSNVRWTRLAEAMQASLRETLEGTDAEEVEYMTDGAHVVNPFLVYGRAGESCGRCGTAIKRAVHGQRSTFYCPSCQRY